VLPLARACGRTATRVRNQVPQGPRKCSLQERSPSSSTAARSSVGSCLSQRRVVVEHEPLDDRQGETAVADQSIVKFAEAEVRSLRIPVPAEEPHDLPLPHHVPDLL